ncbi:aminoimidazole riboside kinase [Cronobacter sakazakii]|uniref:aminoimidazole riboside kinase n=1 Tax=Cronobacter sakazakii TaxID=28141 RepID=UPI000D0182D0|nr:aminoimidazole riboside kinase [Cronobacter sakazakii]ELY2810756.1 aminoimidazole riboside kinase [Cronobacter sakazakii]ELY5889283.1 aminoimidazole riboside kinase [Cronobacter sakazakii]ELY6221734.1 aminoimidazole riboside kinase [Cronobacter sakazakii]QWR91850.1 aminoimidazole riboside kinase [Cronobacter sakazakii]
MSAKVWALGDAVVDLLPDGHGRLLQCPGGAPANVAVGVARLGGASGFIGRVGHDPFGAFMTQTLKEENVDTGAMHQDPAHRTSTVVVALDDRGERSFTFMVRPSADLFLTADDLPPFSAGEWLHVCSIALCAQPSRDTAFEAMARIKRAGGFVSFDPNIREDLWPDTAQLRECIERALALADVVKLSLEELAFIAGADDEESALALARRYAIPLLLITRGAEGVDACFNGELHHYPAVPVECVDTTGAGDAFVAGLLWSLAAQGLPQTVTQLAPVIAAAQACGALATTAKGAMTALPRFNDLQPHLA